MKRLALGRPFMIIGIIGSTAASPDDRGRFAQQIATTIPGVRDAWITMSEPVRIEGWARSYETRIDAASGTNNTLLLDRAVAAVRRAEFAAHHRFPAARRLVESVLALPQRARRYPAALILHQSRPLGTIRKCGDRTMSMI